MFGCDNSVVQLKVACYNFCEIVVIEAGRNRYSNWLIVAEYPHLRSGCFSKRVAWHIMQRNVGHLEHIVPLIGDNACRGCHPRH